MSRYGIDPLEFSGLRTVPLAARGGKVRVEDFAAPCPNNAGVRGLIDSLPRILAANSLRGVLEAMELARANGKPILWGLGGHVIKTGLAPVLIDLMRRGFATAFVLNGAAAIHDFEIALAGCTSEDVEALLPDGRFGSAEETGREMNRAISAAAAEGIGMGEAGHFGFRRLDLFVGPLKSPRPRSEQRMVKRGFHRCAPIIKPCADTGCAGGKVAVESHGKNSQPD